MTHSMRTIINLVENAHEVLDETGPTASRLASHIRKGVKFFMISAQRSALSPAENKARTRLLRNSLAKLPVSFIDTVGEWQEIGTDAPAREVSFFVMPKAKGGDVDDKTFSILAKRLMKAFNQDAVLMGDGERVFLVFQNGRHEDIGRAASFLSGDADATKGYSMVGGKKFTFSDPDSKYAYDSGENPIEVPYGDKNKAAVKKAPKGPSVNQDAA